MSEKNIELAACPFCGSDDTDDSYALATRPDTGDITYFGAGCNSCGCQTDTFECKEDAIKAWNTRPELIEDIIGEVIKLTEHEGICPHTIREILELLKSKKA